MHRRLKCRANKQEGTQGARERRGEERGEGTDRQILSRKAALQRWREVDNQPEGEGEYRVGAAGEYKELTSNRVILGDLKRGVSHSYLNHCEAWCEKSCFQCVEYEKASLHNYRVTHLLVQNLPLTLI